MKTPAALLAVVALCLLGSLGLCAASGAGAISTNPADAPLARAVINVTNTTRPSGPPNVILSLAGMWRETLPSPTINSGNISCCIKNGQLRCSQRNWFYLTGTTSVSNTRASGVYFMCPYRTFGRFDISIPANGTFSVAWNASQTWAGTFRNAESEQTFAWAGSRIAGNVTDAECLAELSCCNPEALGASLCNGFASSSAARPAVVVSVVALAALAALVTLVTTLIV